MSAMEREMVAAVVLSALAALAITQFWSTSTAKWVWTIPVPFLLVRMAMFVAAHAGGGIMAHDSLWKHFFNPDVRQFDLRDSVAAIVALRATIYSLVAWVSIRWAQPAPDRDEDLKDGSAERRRQWLGAVNLLIGINVLIFTAMVVGGVPLLFSKSDQLLPWGADFGPLSLHGQYWRLISSSFVHFDIFHLAGNMIYLWWIGRLAEKLFEGPVVVGIYLLTAVGSAVFSLAWHPLRTTAGASGAIFGIFGVIIVVVFYAGAQFSQNHRLRRRLVVIILSEVMGGFSPYGDNMGHLGGFITGLLIGLLITWAIRNPSSRVFAKARAGLSGSHGASVPGESTGTAAET